MENIILIDKINELTNNEFEFTLKSACLDKGADFCVLEILYKDGTILSKEVKDKVLELIFSLAPKSFKYEIKFIKNFISEQRIENEFSAHLKKNHSAIAFKVESVKLEDMTFYINFVVDHLSIEHAKLKRITETCAEFLKSKYGDYDFKLNMSEGDVYVEDELETLKQNYREEDVDFMAPRKIEFTDVVHLVGEEFEAPASYIKDKKAPEENVVLCGKIKNIKEIIIKKKSKKTDENLSANEESKPQELENTKEEAENPEKTEADDVNLDENKTAYQRKMYKFELEDFTGSVNCIFFSNKENQAKLEKFDVGTVIAVRGNIEHDKFSNDLSLIVHDICYCSIPEGLSEVIVWKKAKPFYEFVKPEPVVLYTQNTLLDFNIEKPTPKFLKNKIFVCYDLETTGLHFETGDRMVEIGAVKIVNGKITEKFSSLINPEIPISEKASEVSGITDDDVKDALKDYQVLQDFYKFVDGAILIGYNNIRFDNTFLIGQGKMHRWNFSGETDDIYNYAQKYVHGVRNYQNSTIYEKLFGKKFENAHRAVYDAMASAESFIKIAEIMDNQ